MSESVDAQRWWVVTIAWNGTLFHGLSFGESEVDAISEFEDAIVSDRYPDGLPKDRITIVDRLARCVPPDPRMVRARASRVHR